MSRVRVVHNRLLCGWYVVTGAHQTPLSGRFSSKEAAMASLNRARDPSAFDPATAHHVVNGRTYFARDAVPVPASMEAYRASCARAYGNLSGVKFYGAA